MILRELDLTYCVKDGVLLITTEELAKKEKMIDETPMPEASERRINKALEKNIDLELDETVTFEEFFGMITKKNPEITVVMDSTGSGSLGFSRSSPVVREPVKYNGVKLRSALQQILSKRGLAYSVTDEVLLITSEKMAKKR